MKKKIISGVLSYSLTIAFVLFMLAGMAATLLRDKTQYSYFENRLLSSKPQFTAEGVLDGSFFSGIDTYVKDYAAGRNTLLKLDTYINKDILHRPVVNDVVIGDDILLPENDYETVDNAAISASAEKAAKNVRVHADTTESYGGHFYYVAVPCQYVCYEDKYPSYLNSRSEYTKASSSALFAEFEKLGINYIDMYDAFVKMGRPDSYTSTVDNHYEIEGGYTTYLAIMERLNTDTDLNFEILTNYTKSELPNTYLGSRSRKLFGMWDTEEKLSVITPAEDIPFKRYDNGEEVESRVYHSPQNEWDDVLYGLYMGGDIAETLIDTDREDRPDILIYGDSFTNAVECVLWYSCDTMRSVDLRHYNDMTIDEYIEKYRPDVVICLRDYEALIDTYGNGQ